MYNCNFSGKKNYLTDRKRSDIKWASWKHYWYMIKRSHRGRMVVGFTTTYAISAYHHWCCEFESRSGRGVHHYVIQFVSDARGRWFSPGTLVSSTIKTVRRDITERLLKVALNTFKQAMQSRSWRGVLDTALCDKVCQWLGAGRWLSLGTPASPTNKTDRHDITEILLKVALNTIV